MSKLRLTVIGNGMAGVKCVEEIVRLNPDLFDITIIGSEPYPNYNRIMLSKVLQGSASLRDIIIHDWDWYKGKGIRLMTGVAAERIDTSRKRVLLANGEAVAYDKLILATGSDAFIPPIPGADKAGVTVFRTIEDCNKLMEAAKSCKSAAVIGGGLLGLEAARGLLHLGMEPTIVHNAPFIMNRQLDQTPAQMLQSELERQGMRFMLEKRTDRIVGRSRAKGLQFSDGTSLPADLIVLSVGIKPRISLAPNTGLRTNLAFIVDDYMRTNVPDIYAVGECAEHRGIAYGLVAPLYEQGKVLARVLCGLPTEPYAGSVPSAQLKVSGVDVFSAGNIHQTGAKTAIQTLDCIRGTYKRVFTVGGKIVGAVLYGDITESGDWLNQVKRGADEWSLLRGGGGSGVEAARELAGSDVVCSCNNVCKAQIVKAVASEGLTTAEEVRDRTKASGSCGGCRPMVEAMVKLTMLEPPDLSDEEPVCGCSPMSHPEFKAAVLGDGAMPETKCASCAGAAAYYKSLSAFGTVEVGSGNEAYIRASMHSSDPDVLQQAAVMEQTIRNAVGTLRFPYPIVLAMTAAPEQKAGLPVSAFGIAATPSGWELYAGGHDELPLKQAKLVAVSSLSEEITELAVSCALWYRESAFWKEPAWKWLQRIGLTSVRERLLDPAFRERLLAWAEPGRETAGAVLH